LCHWSFHSFLYNHKSSKNFINDFAFLVFLALADWIEENLSAVKFLHVHLQILVLICFISLYVNGLLLLL